MPNLSHLPYKTVPKLNQIKLLYTFTIEKDAGGREPGVRFPLGKVCSTVGTFSLPQGKTADEPKGEKDDGQ